MTKRRAHGWLARWLAAPDQMLADGDPIATALFAEYRQVRMPNLSLSDDDVAALLSYLQARSAPGDMRERAATIEARPGSTRR